MSRKKEIQNTLKAEIVLAARRLIKQAEDRPFEALVADFQELCRKVAAWEYLHQTGEEDLLTASSAPDGDHPPKETKETKKVSTPEASSSDQESEAPFIRKHKEYIHKSQQATFKPKDHSARPASAGPLVPRLQIGLADKIALLNNLFDKDAEAYARFVEQIDRARSYDEALRIVGEFKKRFDWEGKDEYEFRLLQLIQAKFA